MVSLVFGAGARRAAGEVISLMPFETGVVCFASGMSSACLNYHSSAPKHMTERSWTCGDNKGPHELGVRNSSI